MRVHELAAVSRAVARTGSRLEKAGHLADCLARLRPEEVAIAASYLVGELPGGRIGIGWSALSEAVRATEPASDASLTLRDVHGRLEDIRRAAGAGSGATKQRVLGELFARATIAERDFLRRLLAGELRQGALEGVMAEAVGRATGISLSEVRRALMLSGDLGEVAAAALAGGRAALAGFTLRLFHPILPMLAQPASDLEEVFGYMPQAAFELKVDGARVQLHKRGDDVRVYSRKRSDVTGAVPEIVQAARELAARELVLDGEAIALRDDGTPHLFQTTMRRFGRRSSCEELRRELPLTVLYFDLLYVEGESMLDRPASERFAGLEEVVPPASRIERVVTSERAEAEAMWARALSRGHEGLMAKSLAAPYAAGGRGRSWLKLKSVHTLDLVVLAAEWGSGRRRGFLSNIHLGARDPHTGGFVMLGKTFKGMTDAMLAWQTETFLALATRRQGHIVHVRPEVVVEVAFGGIQTSPQYPAGLALRFARVKGYRPDKRPEEADTVERVRALAAEGAGSAA